MIVYRELSTLEKDLGISAKTLYAVSNDLSRHYHQVEIPKRSGGVRTLTVPDKLLKTIQRRIADNILAYYPVSPCATAYRYGVSAKINATAHVGQKLLMKLDISNFFDSILYSQVKEKVFREEMYSEPIRVLLTMLCYHKDSLPQGAPSSPTITNIILFDFDNLVGEWCTKRKIVYTRYCDDLTFSGDFDPNEVYPFVRDELKKLGFCLNSAKTQIRRSSQRQQVTGFVVNTKPNIPSDYRAKIRQELYYCKRFGVQSHLEMNGLSEPTEKYLQKLLGRVNYVLYASHNNKEFLSYKKWIEDQTKHIK